MSRPILLSNSQLHVGLDPHGMVHDFYFPHVGLENHTAGQHLHHKIGVYVDGRFHWLDDGSWEISLDYYGDVLISRIIAINKDLQVRLEFDDCVDSDLTAFMRNIHIINLVDAQREIRLFMHQVFIISDANASDTVQYIPNEPYLMHHKGHRVFLINGAHADGKPFDTYSVGLFDTDGHEGTYRDAEDGELMRNNVEHGRVDSVIGFHINVNGHSSHRVHYWISAGRSEREAKKINATIIKDGLLHHVLKTANWWSTWIKPTKLLAADLPEVYRSGFIRSALIIKAQIDKHGAVIASTDTTMLNYERDSYAYCWPRDASFALWPLMRIGYTDELLRFFAFARRSLHDDGYLGHKYQADGALGSSWHPYTIDGDMIAPPIQTDETALVLFLFGQYYRMHPELELLGSFYVTLVKPMANFLSSYVTDDGLPLPSYDIWEEKRLTSTYTAAVTYASLIEAAFLAGIMGDAENAHRWQAAADKMFEARDVFFNDQRGYFYKGFIDQDDGRHFDETIDSSSFFGAFVFGYSPRDTTKLAAAFHTLTDTLMTDDARVIRYEDDAYRRADNQPSNAWPVTSLWCAQFALETQDTAMVDKIFDWLQGAMYASGVIAEQYNVDNQPLSVAPLAWSQAEYMNALLDMITKPEDRP